MSKVKNRIGICVYIGDEEMRAGYLSALSFEDVSFTEIGCGGMIKVRFGEKDYLVNRKNYVLMEILDSRLFFNLGKEFMYYEEDDDWVVLNDEGYFVRISKEFVLYYVRGGFIAFKEDGEVLEFWTSIDCWSQKIDLDIWHIKFMRTVIEAWEKRDLELREILASAESVVMYVKNRI